MKLVCIIGSPNARGSSAKIAERICANLQAKGVSVKTYFLNKMKYVGCQACMACKGKAEICVIKDDLSPVLADVAESDIVILATPVYFGDVSAQMKGFLDRTYSFMRPDYSSRLVPGKKAVMILPQGDPDKKHFSDIFRRYRQFFKWFGFGESHVIRAFFAKDRSATLIDDAYKKADRISRKLVK